MVKNVHIFNNVKNFLYDNDNFMAILNNKIYIYNLIKIDYICSNNIIIVFNNKILDIKGSNLKVIKSLINELELTGEIESVNFYAK